jgi:uncharacterized repeat protein (TIGR01451 family)
MKFARAAVAAAIVGAILSVAPALAQPAVDVTLSQATVVTAADGTSHLVPLDGGVTVARGTLIRYTISAKDNGADPARRLALTGHIPPGTVFAPGSVRGPGGQAEYSLDGKSFSAHPMVAKATPAGEVMVPADPALYVMIRWIKDGPLAAKASIAFSYDVQLK